MENEADTKRLKFLAKAVNEASVHLAIHQDKGMVRLFTMPSKWIETPMGKEFKLDDLRIMLDAAMGDEASQEYVTRVE